MFKPTIEQTACVACGAATHDSALARLRKHLGQEIEAAQEQSKGIEEAEAAAVADYNAAYNSLKAELYFMKFDMREKGWNGLEIPAGTGVRIAELQKAMEEAEMHRDDEKKRYDEEKAELQAIITPMEAELNALDQAAEADSATQAHLDRLRQLLGEKVATLQEAMTSHVTHMAASDQLYLSFMDQINAEKAEVAALVKNLQIQFEEQQTILHGILASTTATDSARQEAEEKVGEVASELQGKYKRSEDLEEARKNAIVMRASEFRSQEATKTDLQTLLLVVTAEKDSCWP